MSYAPRARRHMIDGQLEPGRVLDPAIIEAIARVPRERFVPAPFTAAAYVDEDIPVSDTRYLLEPVIFGRMLEAAQIREHEYVLDIGCATGYSTAVLALLAGHVTGVEEQRELAEFARKQLRELRINNAEIITSALVAGAPVQRAYDAILIEGAVRHIPPVLVAQLREGGRILYVQNLSLRPGERAGLGKAMIAFREDGALQSRELGDASVPLLPGFESPSEFEF